jgi:hypothetical protein
MPTAELTVTYGPAQARRTRRFVAEQMASWGRQDLTDDVAVVAAELTTSALLHTSGQARLALHPIPHGVRVEVHDHSRALLLPGPDAPGGEPYRRGLRLVEALTSRWGVDPDPAGKTVWAELSIHRPDIAELTPAELTAWVG